jgi:hypothetical protein
VRFLFLSGIMTPSVFRHTLLVVCLGFIAIRGFGTLGSRVSHETTPHRRHRRR